MKQSLKGKTILITGAAGGLGSALAMQCAGAGLNGVLLDRNRRGLESVYDAAVARGLTEPALYPLDLASCGPEQVDELTGILDSEFGGLDALIHCAALFKGLQPIDQIAPADWLQTVQVNLNAAWLLSVGCAKLLGDSELARLYFVLEDLDRVAGPYWGAYGVCKHALKALAGQFAGEYASAGIQVLGINPGPMRTDLRAEAYQAEDPGRLPEPANKAGEILKLLSGEVTPSGVQVDL